MTAAYLDRLAARSAAVGSVLCVGLDPDPTALPSGFPGNLAGVERFAALIIEAAVPYAAAVKPNLAFYESHGSAGLAALERLRALIPAGVPVVMDAKRGDIGSTSAHHAIALFERLGADAVTVSPYTGAEAIAPLLERRDRFAYVLCRTSNPGAAELQGLTVDEDPSTGAPAEPLYLRVARRAAGWGPGGTVGLVVGATAPAELAGGTVGRAGACLPGARRRRAGWGDRAGPAPRSGGRAAGRSGRRARSPRQRVARDRRGRPGRPRIDRSRRRGRAAGRGRP